MSSDIILETRGLVKEFKGFVAVNDVNLKVRRGTIHALIGPNGAGKTTCFNLLTKFLEPTRGQILFDGHDITRDKPADIARRGVVRSFQISSTFPNMSVLQNVRVALQQTLGTAFSFWKSERTLNQLNERCMELLGFVGLADYAHLKAMELPYGRKRALEIATTLAMEPKLMLLDEPVAGMTDEETARTAELFLTLKGKHSLMVVEHDMHFSRAIAGDTGTVTVLAEGSVLAQGPLDKVQADERVIEVYLGR